MKRRPQPRRSRSLKSYRRRTRITAILALLAVAGGVVSDVTSNAFWAQHAFLASFVSGVIVVLLSVAVIDEVLARRRKQRWSILAQYVMFELIRNARMIWLGVVEVAGLVTTTENQQESVDAAAAQVRDTAGLTAALTATLDDADGRARLHAEIGFLAEHSDEVLGRWAAVMLNAEEYTEVLDRHVELAGEIAWIAALLDLSDPPDDARRQRRARSSPAIQIQSERNGEWLADRLAVITQRAEALDRGTLDVALRVVPVEWWEAQLRT